MCFTPDEFTWGKLIGIFGPRKLNFFCQTENFTDVIREPGVILFQVEYLETFSNNQPLEREQPSLLKRAMVTLGTLSHRILDQGFLLSP